MPERTGTYDARTEPSYGWCHWHKGPSESAVLVAVVEQQSGPGYGHYACTPCREQRNLTPYAEQPVTGSVARTWAVTDARVQAAYSRYIDHLMACSTCDAPACDLGAELREAWRTAQQAVTAS